MPRLEVRVVRSLRDVPRDAWNALLEPDDNPFVTWDFLEALESSGSVGPERRWWPAHLTVWHGDRLRAAAPAYVKRDGMGDFSRDWAFTHALQQLGGSLYPKLVIGVPFSPVQGRRLLVGGPMAADREPADAEAATAASLLIELAQELARRERLAAVQVLYHHRDETSVLEAAGFAPRVLVQFHWHNRGYRDCDEWLAGLPSKKRTQIRRERREPERQGLRVRVADSSALRSRPGELAGLAFALYRCTSAKHMWGATYLTETFFRQLFERLPNRVELVLAERGDDVVAGAVDIATDTHLYGRYWGCFEEHRFLHFNVCLYRGIEECIARGRSVFEGGAGGEHKLARGFLPVLVPTAHWFAEARIHRALAPALLADLAERERQVDEFVAAAAAR
ncbi:MAG TPA: GNAT family N-acetyltransferase [Thermoanaerobaculia bacterium]|nr:GNAT family N-acetyltransferase [Thermoanaerobaculia bacterium]